MKYLTTLTMVYLSSLISYNNNNNNRDTVGQERFRTVSSSIYRHAKGIILMYDICNRESLTNVIKNWASEADRYAPENLGKVLVGNKSDREADRQVTPEDVQVIR